MKLKVESLATALRGIESDRELSQDIVEEALTEALTKAYRKYIDVPDAYVRVEIKNGNVQIWHERLVVDSPDDELDPDLEVSLEEARETRPGAKPGDMIEEEVDFRNFDRAAVVLAKNVMKQKIREAEKAKVYEEYCDKVDDMVKGTIETVEEKFVIVNIGKTLAMMKKSDQIPTEIYREGDRLPVVITEVNKDTKGAQVLVSRSSPVFVKRLFEREVPEIYNGVIEIKAIAREAGERCKLAVLSHNENIDPIGACIGPRGSRVQTIINELHGEKIDIFEWSDNISTLIKNALAPSEALAVIPNENVKDGLIVVVPDNQLSLAIGKKGKNARLAVRLSGHKIDIKSQSEMDELGIDYQTIAREQEEAWEAKKAAERAYRQQEKQAAFKEDNGEIESIESADFTYAEEPEETPAADTLYESENLPEKAPELEPAVVEEEDLPAVVEEPAAEAAPVKPERELDEMELAAKIAREKRKEHSLETKEYKSKFEDFAGAHAKQEPAAAKKKRWDDRKDKDQDKEKEKKKPSFEAMRPIYSEEELAEIEEREAAQTEAWDDDVDYEEFDDYYD
ncbi:transcription termination factor NusA [uncultured Faecalibaculum sp.]|uniref:transcription termination factor NusA n=1 Tax=uncultured Faecalibaculum sp. TaxID=1729681 RepID=UPI0025D8AE8F|nr:transcription termination factor NusA [uncultured Faecalibaculum sp.]